MARHGVMMRGEVSRRGEGRARGEARRIDGWSRCLKATRGKSRGVATLGVARRGEARPEFEARRSEFSTVGEASRWREARARGKVRRDEV
jgi:hypothetical protein